ncbi:MAG TPA: serine hydrolase domain-containing protein [Gemmatimonadales bacterium]|nr:serine hydrolase domain-containing protein [Gemmatimonadales bacterium]
MHRLSPLSRRLFLVPFALVAACASGENSASAPPVVPDSVHLSRAIAGLRPQVEIEGRPAQRWSLTERMAHYKVPGIGVAIISGGKIVWAGGFGVKEAGSNDSVTAGTLFQAASISKPVTATAMLRLVSEGKIALDTNVNRYLKSWQVPDNKFTATEKVTLRRIASHSAGLTVHGFPGYEAGKPVPSVVQVLNGQKPANTAPVRVDTTPGAISRYSGGGTTIEQLVLTEVTGEPFPALMKRLVLDPAGMTLSTYEQPLPEARWPEAARGYRSDGSMVPGRWHTYPEMAPAGLWTTPTDLAKWALAIAAAHAGGDTTLLPRAIADQMLTVQKGTFGIGPSVEGSGRSFRFGHGGANEGYRANLLYYPDAGVGIAVMTNSDLGDDLFSELQYAIAAEYDWPDFGPTKVRAVVRDSASLSPFVGVYTLRYDRQEFPLTVTLDGGTLNFKFPFTPEKVELVPTDSAGGFNTADRGWRVVFVGDSVKITPDPETTIPGTRNK